MSHLCSSSRYVCAQLYSLLLQHSTWTRRDTLADRQRRAKAIEQQHLLDRVVAAKALTLEVSADLAVAEGKLQQLQQPRIAITSPKRILPNRAAKRTQGSSVVSTAGCVSIAHVSLCVLYMTLNACRRDSMRSPIACNLPILTL